MQACARVKWRFRGSAVPVSLRDGSKIRDFVVFCHRASPRDAIPSALRLPRPQSGLAMTRNWSVLIWKTDVFQFLRLFFACCHSASFFKHFVSEIVPISRKTNQFCHCEEGAIFAPDAAIFNESICHPGTKYGRAERNRTLETSDYHHGRSSGVWIRQGIFSRSEWRSGSPRGHRRSRICPPSRRPRRSPPERPRCETRAAPVC